MTPDAVQSTVQIRRLRPAEWAAVREARMTRDLGERPGAQPATSASG